MSLSWLKSLIFLHPICKFRARLEQCSRLVRILFEVNIISLLLVYILSSSPFLLFRASILPLQIYQPITQQDLITSRCKHLHDNKI